MTAYIFRRLIIAVIILILVSILVFVAMRLLPGDPILMFVTSDQYAEFTDEEIQHLRHQYGLDKSIAEQYGDWVKGIFHGDLGRSLIQRRPVTDMISERVFITLHLGALSFLIHIIVGVPAGVICAVRRGKWIDSLVTILANIGICIPVFWLGILMIYFFGLELKVLPIFGYTSPFKDFWLSTKQLILPVFCLSVFPIAATARQTRSSMLEVMRQDYIRTAWSKGLRERTVILRHAIKNSLIPVVTLMGMGLAQIIGGSVLIETVFNIPGMGRMAVSGVLTHDFPVVQGVVLLIAIVIILVNLAVDLSYGWLDPRIRYA
jgi:peptide/nickel transport system permease protein